MAVARETFSPLIKHPNTRRLSLELCQKFGYNLLCSSTSSLKSSNGNLDTCDGLKTPSPSKNFCANWSQSQSTNRRNSYGFNNVSPSQKTPSSNGNYNCKRRGSDSFRWNSSPFSPIQNSDIETKATEEDKTQPPRRCSLTSLNLLRHFNEVQKTPERSPQGSVKYLQFPDTSTETNSPRDASPISCDVENGNRLDNSRDKAHTPNTWTVGEERILSESRTHPPDIDRLLRGTSFVKEQNEVEKGRNLSLVNINSFRKLTPVTCKIIPPSPKSVSTASPTDETTYTNPKSSIGIFNTAEEEDFALHNGINHKERNSPVNWKEGQRRKSSGSRYDCDDAFMDFVALRCNLDLNPDIILGRGSFGTVLSAHYHGQSVAVKLISTKSNKHSESMKGEENAMSLPLHPNIAKVIDIFQLGPDRALVIMERLRKGNLLSFLNDPRISVDVPLKIRICCDIGAALLFCHFHEILHLDVKPQNVLIDYQYQCKLSDFGNSRKVTDLGKCVDFTKLDGTVPYKAPELFQGICPTDKCDVYSFGISMWQILTRETPYEAEADHSIIYKVVSQGLRPRRKHGLVSAQLRSYIQIYEECWRQEPASRPNMKDVLEKLNHLQCLF